MINLFFKTLLFCLSLGLFQFVQAQQVVFPKLSTEAQFSLITCTPGDQVYNTFGHSAIRLKDPVLRLDFVYNYGTFNFDTPDFVMKFVQRKLLYSLSKNTYGPFERVYVAENRGVSEQMLQISAEQKQKLFEFLETNYQPQNREYLYDFFYDNCATRIRDVFEKGLGAEIPKKKGDRRFRSYLDEYLAHTPWLNFGIDLILGLESDKYCNFSEQMFLPDYLSSNLADAKLNGAPLLSENVWLLPKPKAPAVQGGLFQPFITMLLFLLLSLGIGFGLRRIKWVQNTWSFTALLLLGLVGWFLLFLWFGTDHIATQKNLNVLWANPLFIVWAPLSLFKKLSKGVLYFGYFLLVCNVLALLMFIIPIQQYNIANLPLILIGTQLLVQRLFNPVKISE